MNKAELVEAVDASIVTALDIFIGYGRTSVVSRRSGAQVV